MKTSSPRRKCNLCLVHVRVKCDAVEAKPKKMDLHVKDHHCVMWKSLINANPLSTNALYPESDAQHATRTRTLLYIL
jgi:hypothetical protein